MTVVPSSIPRSTVPTGAAASGPTVAVPAVSGAAGSADPPAAPAPSAASGTSPSWRWIVGTVVLWGTFVALNELGGTAAAIGTAFAGLIAFAVLLTQGKAAIANGVKLFT